ncbi:MAG: methionyl-tRNA formyltransferase [Clostridia bacterium]|nr:methionyl-tRNA formyltransferase [Clostridia bacterium]
MRILFMGTPDFAAYSLQKLLESNLEVCGVVTRADAKKDRGQKIKFSPVKEVALEHNLPVYQPVNLKEENFKEILEQQNPDLIVVVAYGRILPPYVLEYPKYGCINVHASLLPKYRGSAPIQYAVAMGETQSGVTIMQMNEGLDTGDMLSKTVVPITPEETGGSLHDKLMVAGGELLLDTIGKLDSLVAVPQTEEDTCYAPPIKKEETIISFDADAEAICNKIRGFYPFPGTSFLHNDKAYKIHKAELYSKEDIKPYGKIVEFSKNKLLISAKNGIINITELQPPNKKRMSVSDFYNGNKDSFLK